MSKIAAKGTALKIGTQAVGSLSKIGGASKTADTIDVTTLDSADGYKEYIPGWKDGGEVSLSGFFDYSDEGQKALETAFDSSEKKDFTITFPTAAACKWTFSGYVTALETSADLGDALAFSATIKITGKPSLAAVTGGAG